MTCPFAHLKHIRGAFKSSSSHGHAHLSQNLMQTGGHLEKPNDNTRKLKDATWAAHRAIERSPGVAALMGTSSPSSSSRWALERIDYVCFLIMAVCIYSPMEAELISSSGEDWMPVELQSILPSLLRTPALVRDIKTQIIELCGHDASAEELLSYVGARAESSSIAPQRRQVHHITTTALARLASSSRHSDSLHPSLWKLDMSSMITLLDDRQVIATLEYAKRISSIAKDDAFPAPKADFSGQHYDEGVSLTPSVEHTSPTGSRASSPQPNSAALNGPKCPPSFFARLCSAVTDSVANHVAGFAHPVIEETQLNAALSPPPSPYLLLAHIYVRYMGDMSGGQHMAKRLSKSFPVHDGEGFGFEFYTFEHPENLKEKLRFAINTTKLNEFELGEVSREAKLAFDLNRQLLDSLVPYVEE